MVSLVSVSKHYVKDGSFWHAFGIYGHMTLMQWVRHLRFAIYWVMAARGSLVFCEPCITWSLTSQPIIVLSSRTVCVLLVCQFAVCSSLNTHLEASSFYSIGTIRSACNRGPAYIWGSASINTSQFLRNDVSMKQGSHGSWIGMLIPGYLDTWVPCGLPGSWPGSRKTSNLPSYRDRLHQSTDCPCGHIQTELLFILVLYVYMYKVCYIFQ